MSQQELSGQNKSRREFIKGATAITGVSLAPGLFLHQTAEAKSADEAVTSKVRWGMLVDTNKCADGCNDCVKACNDENGLVGHDRPETDAQWIRKVTVKDRMTEKVTSLPLMCQHCENPPCVDVCPTGASFRRDDGIVMVDKHICIGCRYCMMACPYKARSFIHETLLDQKPHAPRGKGTVESCTFCAHKLDQGETETACSSSCSHDAITFGDLNDPSSDVSQRLKQVSSVQLRADLELNTGVRYQGL
jgi:molybdopterin-containing oxidoreductase family iron-sulfur binding subunit